MSGSTRARRLARLEEAAGKLPTITGTGISRVQAAVSGMRGEERVVQGIRAAGRVAREMSGQPKEDVVSIFAAWLQTLPDDERRLVCNIIGRLYQARLQYQSGMLEGAELEAVQAELQAIIDTFAKYPMPS